MADAAFLGKLACAVAHGRCVRMKAPLFGVQDAKWVVTRADCFHRYCGELIIKAGEHEAGRMRLKRQPPDRSVGRFKITGHGAVDPIGNDNVPACCVRGNKAQVSVYMHHVYVSAVFYQ